MSINAPGAERIIEAAIACFGERGVAGTSMQVIAREAGTSQALIVHHFGSKQALAGRCTTVVLERADELARTDPSGAVEALAKRSADIRYLGRVLTDDPEPSRALFRAAVERAASLRPDVDPDAAVVLAVLNLAPLLLLDRISEALPEDTWGRFTRAVARVLAPSTETEQ